MPSLVHLSQEVSASLHGFTAVQIPAAAKAVAKSLVPDDCFPHLKSNPVHVVQGDGGPLYYTSLLCELIELNCGPNLPWQFTYQFAHEMMHLLSRSSLRHGKDGRHRWIEEALCGAGSVHAMKVMAASKSDLAENAAHYLHDMLKTPYVAEGVVPAWFEGNRNAIVSATTLTESIQKISALIAERFPDGAFVFDNRALIGTPLNADLDVYLDEWEKRSPNGKSGVPALIRSLVRKN